jgi:hypothetical protein
LTLELLQNERSKLRVEMPEGSFSRDYYAPCHDAVAAVAVIASMVLESEPEKRATLIERAPEQGPSASAEFPPEPVRESQVLPEPPAPVPAPVEQKPPAPAVPPARPFVTTPAPKLTRLAWAVSAGGALETAVAPRLPLGVTAGVEGFLDRAGWWAPGLQASVLATTTSTYVNADGEARFRLLAGQLRVCTGRLPARRAFRLMPCAVLEAGSLFAEGGGSAINERQTTMPWLAAGAVLRGQLDLAANLALESSAALKLLARRDTFIFRPNSLVYQVPRWSVGLGLGLTLRMS